ncbi:MAG: DUF3422 domain-containing protein [Sphingomonas sp.]|uniref:DUF3422 family protein n=1 Tax=Sphingomonas sp. TaxID=28214 RepID=UPI0025F53579|nr:DUF3422 domain-containing protein [Sphingomonas sp.]MBX9882042.1 DUF3422 domain-containing protein [Sphingomonas sp.]
MSDAPVAFEPPARLTLALRSHPLRASLSAEMHVRRLPRFASPARAVQIVTLLGETGEASWRHVCELAARGGLTIAERAKYAVVPLDDMTLVWERHTEFASYTLLREGSFDVPFDPGIFDPVGAEVLAGIPGEVIRATQIAIAPRDRPPPAQAVLDRWFDPGALVVCDVAGGKARLLSDFKLHADGYGRLLILDQGLEGDEPSQLVTRVQELGNYRNMALLGLPLAQATTPEVTKLEHRLAVLTHDVSERRSEDDALLDELTFLSAELARLAAATRYRMSATKAYAQLSLERLHALDVAPVPGHQTLSDFTERRLTPAVRTCDSFSNRIEDLQRRAGWTSSLLRTRIDIALAKQNRDLLGSMDRRTKLQLRLQQTVEGLSVVAISYYAVALLAYPIKALPGINHELAIAVSVPAVLLTVAALVGRMRRHLSE